MRRNTLARWGWVATRSNQRVARADLIVAVGDRLSEMVTQDYTLLKVPVAQQKLVHVLPEPSQLGRVYQPTLSMVSGMAEFAAAAYDMAPVNGARWGHGCAKAAPSTNTTARLRP